MDIDAVRTFVTIAREHSFSRAGGKLHRSQPAISRRIELLEQEFGVPLFERLRGGAALTDAGVALLPHAEAVLAAARDGAEAVRALTHGDLGTVSLALVGTLANSSLIRALRKFQRRYPKVRLDLQTATSQQVSELVRRGDATLGLRYLDDRGSDLVARPVASEALVVVCSRDHRLADGCRHRASELCGERWVAFPTRRSRESFVQFLERRLLAAGLESPEIIPIDSLTAQKRLVEAGFGIALLAESGIQEELRLKTLHKIDVPTLRSRVPVCVIHRRNGHLSPAARNLLSCMLPSGIVVSQTGRRAKSQAGADLAPADRNPPRHHSATAKP
ncbi:LysR family transcriptional regulator [Bradyrhizobium cenepequi]|uniref:LysR family transcriptional regulator n=1 Tax=Bradyrhizobium cenepequi TaxID=2821403 RepID=UPI001CE2CD6E|nr:LysR family transcriptional regulator [Bradyrhizobium cenepequi]MCA6109581.1 LysR family transcriptional regulator [Bradyrhizobium cenepequi]